MVTPFDEFRHKFNTELIYTRRQMTEALENQSKSMIVNRVVQSFDGKYGPNCKALKILAIHTTPEGVLVIVE